MSANRITKADVEHKIELVKSAALAAGLTTLSYQGSTFESLHLHRSMGTCWLMGEVDAEPWGGGTENIGYARGLHDVAVFLNGMYAGIDAARHTANMTRRT